jgi:hypothetical protein
MKNQIKFYLISSALLLGISTNSFAINNGEERDHAAKFAQHKSQILENINMEKSTLDKMASCVKSAANKEGMKKCRHIKKDGMKKIKSNRLQKRKANLQNKMRELEKEESQLK